MVFAMIFGDKASFLQCQEPLLAQAREEVRRAEEEHAAEKDATCRSAGKTTEDFISKHGDMNQLNEVYMDYMYTYCENYSTC